MADLTTIAKQLFQAIEQGSLDTVTGLVDASPGLVYVRQENEGLGLSTSLQYAAAKGRLDICKYLVERGAEVYTNPMNTYPPVLEAAWNNHQDVVDYFLNEIPDKAHGTNKLGVTINLAGRKGWTDLVRRHIERDPLSVHYRGWIGDSPLHWPAHNNSVDIVEMLLDAGAAVDADEVGWIGGKPLQWASEHAPKSVEVLLRRGADVNSRNIKADSPLYGVTPLIMNATQKDDCSEVTELLIAAGADIQSVDANGKNALDHAVERGLVRIIDVLTRNGATQSRTHHS